MSVVPGSVDAERARELAQAFVGSEVELTLCDGTPVGLYLVSRSDCFYFLVSRPNQWRVGGDKCVSVSKVTGLVRSVGYVGE